MTAQTRFPTSLASADEAATKAPCLSDTQLLWILDGTVLLHDDAQAEDHIDECEECRALLIAMLRSEATAATSGRRRPTS